MTDTDTPDYIPRRFFGAKDRYDKEEWKLIWDGFGLEGHSGFINCDECGDELHVYSASRDDPGYNEHTGSGYVIYDYQLAICGRCLYEAFGSVKRAINHE